LDEALIESSEAQLQLALTSSKVIQNVGEILYVSKKTKHGQTSSTHKPPEDVIDWTTLQQLGWRFMQEIAN